MKSWIRITLVISILIGGTTSFGYWSINQFDSAFDNLSAPYFANIHSVYPVRGNDSNGVYPPKDGLAPTSPEISGELATSTELELSFTFPQKDTEVYIGCTYPISWQSSTTINLLEASLIDAGTREAVGPKTGGLAKENTIEKEPQNLNWKVGFVWPGAYYIKVSKINGVEAEFRSKTFQIGKLPEGINEEEKINICRESSG